MEETYLKIYLAIKTEDQTKEICEFIKNYSGELSEVFILNERRFNN